MNNADVQFSFIRIEFLKTLPARFVWRMCFPRAAGE